MSVKFFHITRIRSSKQLSRCHPMSLPRVVHSSQRLLTPSSLLPLLQGHRYIIQHNQYLLPFRGQIIHHHNFIIDGRFLYPVSNVFEQSILSKGTRFPYTYIREPQSGPLLELQSSSFVPYHVSTGEKWYNDSIHLSRASAPHDSCLFLFAVDAKIAEPLIRQHLL